jgi:hypothetical protein
MDERNFLKCSCQSCGGHIEFPSTGVGSTIDCPHCGGQTTLNASGASRTTPHAKKPLWAVSGGVLLALILGTIVLTPLFKKQKEAAVPSINPPSRAETPHPPPPQSESLDDFNLSKISLQKTDGSGLVYAVGTLKNNLDRQRFGVKIELNLIDEQGANIGVASDYVSVIEPKKEWQFKALLTQAGAVKVTVADIKEQQ